jgi:large subunit ribosomal protein L9
MQVILLEKVQKLGNLGDEVNVKSGFGRNFLVPTGKALPANKKNREVFEARRAELEKAAAELLAVAEARKEKLVAAGDINILANAGAEVERNEVRLPQGALRQTGEYNIDVQFHADVIVTVNVSITSEAEIQAKAAAEEAAKAKAKALEEAEALAKAQEEE